MKVTLALRITTMHRNPSHIQRTQPNVASPRVPPAPQTLRLSRALLCLSCPFCQPQQSPSCPTAPGLCVGQRAASPGLLRRSSDPCTGQQWALQSCSQETEGRCWLSPVHSLRGPGSDIGRREPLTPSPLWSKAFNMHHI